jgi:serine/threonine-protein kinase
VAPSTPSGQGSGRVVDGKYRVLRLLPGKGDVMRLLAEHPNIGRTVELRMLSPRQDADPLAQRLLEREARALGAAPHPHLQSVLDSGVDEGRPYVALEALEGPTVAELVAEGGLPVERAARLVLQALDGIRALHKRRVVIRALSPDNVVVLEKRDGEVVKLRGLDRAEFLDAEPSGLAVPFSPYLAPEIRRGDDGRDPRVDVYSAGVLFRHLLTGRAQPGADVRDELALRAIHRATSEDPDDRFPSAEVCMQAVAVCAGAEEQLSPRKLPADPLVRDLHYLTLRRRTQHGTLAEDRKEARVELAFVLFCIEAIFRHVGHDVWARLADEVPEVEALLPSAGQSGLHGQQGVSVELFERILEAADHLGGQDDLGLLAVVADAMVERGPQRLFPELGAAPSAGTIVDAAPFLWSRIARQGRAVVQARHDESARIVIVEQAGPSLELSGLFAALVRALLRRAAGERVDVSVLACSALGDAADVLALRW